MYSEESSTKHSPVGRILTLVCLETPRNHVIDLSIKEFLSYHFSIIFLILVPDVIAQLVKSHNLLSTCVLYDQGLSLRTVIQSLYHSRCTGPRFYLTL